jgi:hypothetical protein
LEVSHKVVQWPSVPQCIEACRIHQDSRCVTPGKMWCFLNWKEAIFGGRCYVSHDMILICLPLPSYHLIICDEVVVR